MRMGSRARSSRLAAQATLVSLALVSTACTKASSTPDRGLRPTESAAAFSEQFPYTELGQAANGCKADHDCIAVRVGGACWPVLGTTLQSPLADQYKAWTSAGLGKPSGSPDALGEVPADDFSRVCGIDWAKVVCKSERCELEPSDCEWEGMTQLQCEERGGRWGGCARGRGRNPGCNTPTKDAGRTCKDSGECEGACVKGFCTAYMNYRGCGGLVDGKTICVD